MQIGRLDTRIRIESPVEQTGAMGDRTREGTSLIAIRWASVKAKAAGTESPEGNQIVARHQYTIRLRYLPQAHPKQRIVLLTNAGTILEIVSVSHVQKRDRYTEIIAVESKTEEAA